MGIKIKKGKVTCGFIAGRIRNPPAFKKPTRKPIKPYAEQLLNNISQ
jgi:hypothetical protein